MAVTLRRLAFGVFWFGIFWVALTIIGGGIADSIAGAKSTPAKASVQKGFESGYQAGSAAGVGFQKRYGVWVVVGAAALATVGTVTGLLPGTRRTSPTR